MNDASTHRILHCFCAQKKILYNKEWIILTYVECQCGPTSVASASKNNTNKKRRYKAKTRQSACGLHLAQLASCCTLLLNFNLNHLRFVRRHVYCFLISQLKGSACDPLVYFTPSKISRLFVLVCSRKKKRGRKKRKNTQTCIAPLGSCQYCNYLHHFDALQGLRREHVFSANAIWQTGNVMKRTTHVDKRQMPVNNCWVC